MRRSSSVTHCHLFPFLLGGLLVFLVPMAVTGQDDPMAVAVLETPKRGGQRVAQCVAFSHDGKLLAAGCTGTVRIWDVAAKKELRTLSGHSGTVGSIAFSPNAQMLAGCSGSDGNITIWELTTGKKHRAIKAHQYAVDCVTWSPHGRMLASSGGDETLKIWDVADGKKLAELKIPDEAAYGLVFTLDSKTLISSSTKGFIYQWEVAGWKRASILRGHDTPVTSLALAGNGQTFATGSGSEEAVKIWSSTTGAMITRISVGKINRAVAISPDGRLVATGSSAGWIKIWHVDSGKAMSVLKGHAQPVPGIAFSPDGRLLASACHDETVTLWDVSGIAKQLEHSK